MDKPDNYDYCKEMRCPKLFKDETCLDGECVFQKRLPGIQIFFIREDGYIGYVSTIGKESKH